MHRSQDGFTFLEAILACAVMGLVLGALVELVSRSVGTTGHGTSMAVLDMRAGQALERITTELMSADLDSLQPPSPQGSSEITFRQCTGFVGAAPQWSAVRRIAFVPATSATALGGNLVWGGASGTGDPVVWLTGVADHLDGETANGVDDNGNGLIDERGLCFSLNARFLTIRLTVRGMTPQGVTLTRTLTTGVHLLN